MTGGLAVVTGASGLLGATVVRHLAERSERVLGWSGTARALPDGTALDPVDLGAVGPHRILRECPDLVVHCAAATDVDGCEAGPEVCWPLNAVVPGRLAAAAAEVGSRFVHISTDAVYDGERAGTHAEDEPPRPANQYAASKLQGERAVLDAFPEALVIRTTMHGWGPRGLRSFSEAVLARLARRESVPLFSDVRFSPLVVTDLARDVLDLAGTGASGVVNAGSRDAVDKERFGRLLAAAFGLDDDGVVPTSLAQRRLLAPRPRNTALDVTRCERLLGRRPPSVADGIERMRQEAEDGRAASLRGRAPGPWRLLVEDVRS